MKDEEQGTIVHFPAPAALGPTSVKVAVEVHPKYTIDRVRQFTRAELDRVGFHVRDETKLKLSGRDASLFRGDGPFKGTEMTVLELVVWDAPRTYRVTAMCRTEDWARDEGALRASVDSFKLDDKKK